MEIVVQPDIDIQDADKKLQTKRIEQWGEYLKKQTIVNVTIFPPGMDDVAFLVSFPVSFMHLRDFKQGIGRAVGIAKFRKDGEVRIAGINDEDELPYNYRSAWNEIYQRCTGQNMEFILATTLPDQPIEGDFEKKIEEYTARLDAWAEAFKKIPIVAVACVCDAHDVWHYGQLLQVTLYTNASFVSDRKNAKGINDFYLGINGTIKDGNYYDGECDKLWDVWIEEGAKKYETRPERLEDFYEDVIDLNNRYLNAIPEPPTV